MTLTFAPARLPFAPRPIPTELFSSWLLRVAPRIRYLSTSCWMASSLAIQGYSLPVNRSTLSSVDFASSIFTLLPSAVRGASPSRSLPADASTPAGPTPSLFQHRPVLPPTALSASSLCLLSALHLRARCTRAMGLVLCVPNPVCRSSHATSR